ncbi:MAG: LAGLIDADG family homing endonuclease [Desulfobacterales bacterium]
MSFWAPQPGPQFLALTCPADEILFGGSRGGGKGLAATTNVLTPFGWKAIGNLQIGDKVCAVDGSVTHVLAVHHRGRQPIYRCHLSDGVAIDVDGDHLWFGWRANKMRKEANRKLTGGRAARKYSMAELVRFVGGGRRFAIPVTKPVAFNVAGMLSGPGNFVKRDVIRPYVLGVLLGNGALACGGVRFSTPDREVAEKVESLLDEGGLATLREENGCVEYRVVDGGRVSERLNLLGLRGKLAGEKFIPRIYLYGTVDERWELLRGLMDTDGWAEDDGEAYYCTVSPELAENVRELAWSLGAVVTVRKKSPVYTYRGERRNGQPAFSLRLKFEENALAFSLPRKRKLVEGKTFQSMARYIERIERAGEGETVCISVAHPSSLYIAEGYIVTHNSSTIIGRHLRGVEKYGRDWNGLIVRRRYKDLNDMRRQWDELIARGLPAERVGGETQPNYIRFKNGATVSLFAFQRLEQADDIQGHQYPEIGVDEATNFPWFAKLMDKLRAANRSPAGVPTHIFCTGNPGGPGHAQVKSYFRLGREGLPPGTVFRDEAGLSRVFIQSFLSDNRVLVENDPKYAARLASIQDPALRRAWLEGDWDVFIGQAFQLTSRHIIRDGELPAPPPHVPLYMTFDWGFGVPFSVMWWWVDSEDRLYGFAEWYGMGGAPGDNEGLRLTDSEIADGIIEREAKMGIWGRPIVRLAGPDCWNKKPGYMGGGQGPSTAEVFRDKGLALRPGDPSREAKLRAFRERIALPRDPAKRPMLVVYESCKHFIRTIQSLVYDDERPEYLDEEQELHAFDSACHVVMARAKGVSQAAFVEIGRKERKEAERAILPREQRAVWRELDEILERQKEEEEEWA